jgi:hypothetical protein
LPDFRFIIRDKFFINSSGGFTFYFAFSNAFCLFSSASASWAAFLFAMAASNGFSFFAGGFDGVVDKLSSDFGCFVDCLLN